MQKKDLVEIINEVFIPLSFKKKGNDWSCDNGIITKVVNLQKSNFGNFFYINYGYILSSIPLGNRYMHIEKRLSSYCNPKKIIELLDCDINIPKEGRLSELKQLILDEIALEFNRVHTENDILEEIKKLPSLNILPLVVRKHFNLPCD